MKTKTLWLARFEETVSLKLVLSISPLYFIVDFDLINVFGFRTSSLSSGRRCALFLRQQAGRYKKSSTITFMIVEDVYGANAFITSLYFLLMARSTATAIATVAPTIGLLPMPRKPIISTCAGTEEEPAN